MASGATRPLENPDVEHGDDWVRQISILPFPKNPLFYGQESIMELLYAELCSGASRGSTDISSVVLTGLGCVGKTAIGY
ncbi:hypothetical protein EJ03DRAFT_157135 [Teratosphaeria nubilosa]|uniref:Uncharacterized protein n=1 Tax=Teratosphaeria nubilosa TaxID=161662 RepID=A0A6G1L371_9PEZI|nr:hypothetical protein EJ03DRAFT_157135 [Teratosphaeria nubilosa]